MSLHSIKLAVIFGIIFAVVAQDETPPQWLSPWAKMGQKFYTGEQGKYSLYKTRREDIPANMRIPR